MVCVAGYYCLHFWNKSDFCNGWAEHHSDRSYELDMQMLVALQMDRMEDAKELAVAARQERLIADKYDRVARNPLLPYPAAPLIGDEEMKRITKDSESLLTGQIPFRVPRS